MTQSTLRVHGFFQLCNPTRLQSPRRTDPSASTFHYHYVTSLQCRNNSGLSADLRFFSPPGDSPIAHGTVCFIEAKAYLPPSLAPNKKPVLLEGVLHAELPGDPNADDYQSHAPDLSFAMIHGLGVVTDSSHGAVNVDDKEFSVELRPWVRDDNRSCTVTYVSFHCTLMSSHFFAVV